MGLSLYASPLACQTPIESIRALKQGTLLIRFPAYKTKIDTLQSMISRTGDGTQKKRLQLLLNEAIQERDTLLEDYTAAFRDHYDFSKAAYFNDYESKNLNTAHYFKMDGGEISFEELHRGPVFYLFFERTGESKVDALVFYDQNLKPLPKPFPNNFTRGGINLILSKFSGKPFANFLVKKINKKLHKFYDSVN